MKLFLRVYNETLSVVAVGVCNENRARIGMCRRLRRSLERSPFKSNAKKWGNRKGVLVRAVFVLDICNRAVRIDSESGEKMEPFQLQFVVVLEAGIANGGAFETVPAGKRAVIEHVSVYTTGVGTAVQNADYFITSTNEDNSTFREVPIVTKVGALGVLGSHSFRAFAAPGTQFGGVIRRLDTTERISAAFVIAGHFTPVP